MSPLRAPARAHPRMWVLVVVRAALLLTVLVLGGCSIAATWTGPFTGSNLWLAMGLPQLSIALLAVVLCWGRDSRPSRLWPITVLLTVYGLIFAVALVIWPLVVMGALILVAMYVSPREWVFSGPPPPRFVWVRDHLLGQDCDPEPHPPRRPFLSFDNFPGGSERPFMRYVMSFGVLPSLAGIPVAIAHGVPRLAGTAAGCLLALAFVLTAAYWSRRWGMYAYGLCTVLVFWPALVWGPWAGLAGLHAGFVVVVVAIAFL